MEFWSQFVEKNKTFVQDFVPIKTAPTLREEFVEKKYQVFNIIGLLIILVQVNLFFPVERV